MLKVFLGGEGNNDIGTRWYRPMGDTVGVVETLLRRVRASGWHVAGALPWNSLRKYRAGVAMDHANHADARNVLGLVLHAYEDACEMLVFVRDEDGDEHREQAIRHVLEAIASYGFALEYPLRSTSRSPNRARCPEAKARGRTGWGLRTRHFAG
jgi:hypothetical protein